MAEDLRLPQYRYGPEGTQRRLVAWLAAPLSAFTRMYCYMDRPPDEAGTDVDSDESGPAAGDETSPETGGFRTWFHGWSRRRQALFGGLVVAALVAVVVAVLVVAVVPPGVLGLAVTDTARFAADPAAPDDAALADVGYVQTSNVTLVVHRQISHAGQERTVVVTNHRRTYERTVERRNHTVTSGTFLAFSSPTITVAGSSRNPLVEMSHRDILQRFESDLGPAKQNRTYTRVGQREVEMLDQRATVSEFRTTADVDGEEMPVSVYVTRVRSEGDVVVAVGFHPTDRPGERDRVMRLFRAVEHPAG